MVSQQQREARRKRLSGQVPVWA